MKWNIRPSKLLTLALIGLLPFAAVVSSHAQGWKPTRPVAFLVGAAAGGSSLDLTARLLQKIWDENRTIGSTIVVVNKPGAGNGIAWSALNDRGSDGHAIAIGTTNLVSNPVMGAHHIGHRDVTPLALLFEDYLILLVRADSPLKTMIDLRDRLVKDPASVSISFGPGLGAAGHTAAAVVVKALGIDVTKARFIPFKSAGEAATAMLGGDIDVLSTTSVNAASLIATGRIRGLGLIAPQRLGGTLSGVPTVREQGVNAGFTNWRLVIGPKGIQKHHVAFWEQALLEANKTEAWKKDLERNFWKDRFLTGSALHSFLDEQAAIFRGIWADIGKKN